MLAIYRCLHIERYILWVRGVVADERVLLTFGAEFAGC
jgi:hypothetical protein